MHEKHPLRAHVNEKTHVAFVDVLGCGEILTGTNLEHDEQRLERLLEIWENLCVSLDGLRELFPNVEFIQFSDAVYLCCDDHRALAGALVWTYLQSYGYYEAVPSSWMPWLRAGIAYNWVVDMKDSSVSARLSDASFVFRNPAGPALAEAYTLSEKCGFKGMRILVPEDIAVPIMMDMKTDKSLPEALRAYAPGLSRPWPEAGEVDLFGTRVRILDLPWWRAGNNSSGLGDDIFLAHRWQTGDSPAALEHFDTTIELIRSG